MEKRFLKGLVSDWVDLGSVCGRIMLFMLCRGLGFLSSSMTETIEVSGSFLVARKTKSRPKWVLVWL